MFASTSQHVARITARKPALILEFVSCSTFRASLQGSACYRKQHYSSSQPVLAQVEVRPTPPLARHNRQPPSQYRNQPPGQVRNLPYHFQADPVQYHRSSNLAQFNIKLFEVSEKGWAVEALKLCAEMKEKGVTPDLVSYNCLIHALALQGHHQEAWSAYNDMVLMKIEPNIETFNHLLMASRFLSAHSIFHILDLMKRHSVEPDVLTYSHIIRYYIRGHNLELALQYIAEMNARGMGPTLKTAEAVISRACSSGYARLALDMAESYEQTSVRRLEAEVWVEILLACSETYYTEGVEYCWRKVVDEMKVTPDEGLCLQVLHVCSRHGLPILAADVMKQLEGLGVQMGEWHVEPLLEAFTVNRQIKEAFRVLELLRSSGTQPSSETVSSILRVIQHDPDAVDDAWGVLDELRAAGENVDIVAVNVVIQAAVSLNDLSRAVGVYKALAELGVTPNASTYTHLLAGCVRNHHRDLGYKLVAEMKEKGVVPEVQTYEQLIRLCLTQVAYEDAFFYLEEMKGLSLVPTYSIYEALVRKLVEVGDTRYKLAVDELLQMGYAVSPRLRMFINTGGESDMPPREPGTDQWTTQN